MSDPFDPALDPLRSIRGLDGVAALGGLYLLAAVTVPVVPLVAGVGYLLDVLDAAARNDDHPSLFGNVGRLARRTVGGSLIAALYGGLPAAILAMTLFGASRLPGDAAQGTVTGLAITLGSTASLFLAMAIAYLLPAAWGLYADSGRLRDAVALGRLGPITRAPAYFVWTVAGWTVLIAGLGLGDALSAFVVGFFVAGYATVVAVGCWGRGLARTDAAPGG
ncbi:MAG: DUF4013 domain-containing protein [Halococcoides sp.]